MRPCFKDIDSRLGLVFLKSGTSATSRMVTQMMSLLGSGGGRGRTEPAMGKEE